MGTVINLLLILVALTCYRLYNNSRQLANIPGPALAGLSDLWRAWYQYNGLLRNKLVELHKQHGPVVRYGVRSVSINDPSVIDIVYGSKAGWTIADSYGVLRGIAKGKEVSSLVSTEDEARHGAMRRSISSAFSANGVLDYEKHFDATIPELVDFLGKRSIVDLSSTILYSIFDAAGRFVYNTPSGCLAKEEDVGGSIQLVRDRLTHWGWWSSIPALERLVYRNPIAMHMKRAPSSMAAVAASRLRAHAEQASGSSNSTDVLSKFVDAIKAHPDVLDPNATVGLLMSVISGASDTTATALTATLYYLMRNPDALRTLETELADAKIDMVVPAYSQVSKLPYLNAVIREAMRLCPVSNWPIERRVPTGGATLAGVFLPQGTSVGCSPLAVHLNQNIYGDDAHTFEPGRWLIGDSARLRQMEVAHLGFSRGRRVCLGQNVAVMQMKKIVAALVLSFRITLINHEQPLEADFSAAVAYVKPVLVHVERKMD